MKKRKVKISVRQSPKKSALVCERHTGAGLSLEGIIAQDLPVPHREMVSVSLEEQAICFADKFYSKTHLTPFRDRQCAAVRCNRLDYQFTYRIIIACGTIRYIDI